MLLFTFCQIPPNQPPLTCAIGLADIFFAGCPPVFYPGWGPAQGDSDPAPLTTT